MPLLLGLYSFVTYSYWLYHWETVYNYLTRTAARYTISSASHLPKSEATAQSVLLRLCWARNLLVHKTVLTAPVKLPEAQLGILSYSFRLEIPKREIKVSYVAFTKIINPSPFCSRVWYNLLCHKLPTYILGLSWRIHALRQKWTNVLRRLGKRWRLLVDFFRLHCLQEAILETVISFDWRWLIGPKREERRFSSQSIICHFWDIQLRVRRDEISRKDWAAPAFETTQQ